MHANPCSRLCRPAAFVPGRGFTNVPVETTDEKRKRHALSVFPSGYLCLFESGPAPAIRAGRPTGRPSGPVRRRWVPRQTPAFDGTK